MLIDINMLPKKSEVFIHVCCGACLNSVFDIFNEGSIDLRLFFFNPNIHPYAEFLRRREALLAYLKLRKVDLELEIPEYEVVDYFRAVNGFEDYPDRCRFCYRLRFQETAKKAAENGIKYITSTIFASPYQKKQIALEEALRAAETFDLAVVNYDIEKKRYREKVEEFKKDGFYYQNYCGCIFSEVERLIR
ncbi:MAG: epoxyqueuosine reductase QueH [Actinobacteria bacterium]|nr:epoxyqueuosine reductase QueH [Actinomycetota bacterium]